MLAAVLGTLAIGAGVAEAKTAFGVIPQGGQLPGTHDFKVMSRGGISMMRLTLYWGAIEQSPDGYDWGHADTMIRKATEHGIVPLLVLFGTPVWAAQHDGIACGFDQCATYAPSSPETREAFANFAAAAVRRYGPNGDFWRSPGAHCDCSVARPITAWQIWNEQNSPKYYAPRVDPQGYAQTVIAAGTAIKAADPGVDVILGGMWGPRSADEVTPVRSYLEQLYDVPDIESSFDSVAVHPYSQRAGRSVAAVQAARGTLTSVGDPEAGLWITEMGWASDGPKDNPVVKDEQGQARLLRRTFSTLLRKRRALQLRGIFWYSWRDQPGGKSTCVWCGHAGLRRKDGSPKPAWKAFAKIARR